MVLAPNPYLLVQRTLPPLNTHQIMKAIVEFNDFADWYLGDMPNTKYIIDEFQDQLEEDVSALVDTQVTIESTYIEELGLWEVNINDGQLVLDAVDDYFTKDSH